MRNDLRSLVILVPVVILAPVLTTLAQLPPANFCAELGSDTVCDGCTNHEDNCTCLAGSHCFTNHKQCYERPVTANPSTDPCDRKTKRTTDPCWWRYECVNGNGEDGGTCTDPNDCETNQGERKYGGEQQYYEDLGLCNPEQCQQ